jgi:hypothetical protein
MQVWADDAVFDAHFRDYLALLSPLFAPVSDEVQDVFNFICCLVHVSGTEGADEDPLSETVALIEDLVAFSRDITDTLVGLSTLRQALQLFRRRGGRRHSRTRRE